MAKIFKIEDFDEPLNFYAETNIEEQPGRGQSRNHIYFAPDVDEARPNNESVQSICEKTALSTSERRKDLDEEIVHLQELNPNWTSGDLISTPGNLCHYCANIISNMHEKEAWKKDFGY